MLPWSCQAYDAFVGGQDGNNEAFEESMRQLYPPLDIIESGPATVADKAGVVVLYFVPDAIRSDRQVSPAFAPPQTQLIFVRPIFLWAYPT